MLRTKLNRRPHVITHPIITPLNLIPPQRNIEGIEFERFLRDTNDHDGPDTGFNDLWHVVVGLFGGSEVDSCFDTAIGYGEDGFDVVFVSDGVEGVVCAAGFCFFELHIREIYGDYF